MRVEGVEAVYELAGPALDVVWDGGSLWGAGAVWSLDSLQTFYGRMIENPDLSAGKDFYDKLQGQVAGAGDEVVQLAAEMLALYYLPVHPRATAAATKTSAVERVLSWMSEPVELPERWREVFELGLFHPGTYYNTRRDQQFGFVMRAADTVRSLSAAARQRFREDPWFAKETLLNVPLDSAYTMRRTLLHLAFPDTFEPIVSGKAKSRIVDRFIDVAGDSDDTDRQLLAVRDALSSEFGEGFNFYAPEIKRKWQPDSSPWGQLIGWADRFVEHSRFDEERARMDALAARVAEARSLWSSGTSEWTDRLFSVLATASETLLTEASADAAAALLTDGPTAGMVADAAWSEAADPGALAARFDDALPSPDATGTPLSGRGERVALLSVLLLSDEHPAYRYGPANLLQHQVPDIDSPPRTAGELWPWWLDTLDRFLAEADDHGLTLTDRLDAQIAVWSVLRDDPPQSWSAEDRRRFRRWREGTFDPSDEDEDDVSQPATPSEAGPVDSSGEGLSARVERLAASLLLEPTSWLHELVELLLEKKQIVLDGPPGTGKTYLAQKLAGTLADGADHVELVQFHASYSYEDFVQGYRPMPDGTLQLRDGPLVRLARAAKDRHDETFVLVIDEVNRGNVAKVFGELYFLLEYRGQQVTLQYDSDSRFTLPDNLLIIGTMNTADQSIALLDAALRRRFYFFTLAPDSEPIAGLLGRWLDRHKPDQRWLADIVERANDLLGDPDSAIGPSHFMAKRLDDRWAELIWRHAILPHVAERLYDQPRRLHDFKLATLRRRTDPPSAGSDTKTDESGAGAATLEASTVDDPGT